MIVSPFQKPFRGAQINLVHPLARGLVSAWAFNEMGGLPFDLIRHQPAISVVTADWATGVGGAGFNFPNTSGNSVRIKSGSLLGGLPAWTVCIYYSTTAGAPGTLYAERGSSGNDILKLQSYSTGVMYYRYVYRNDAGTLFYKDSSASHPTVNDGLMHMSVMQRDGAVIRGYYDGKLDMSETYAGGTDCSFTDATNQCWIGADQGDSGHYCNGNIYAVFLYSRALTPEEVSFLAAAPYCMFSRRADIGAFEYVSSGGTTYTQSLTGELPYPSGSLLYSVSFSAPLTGDLPSPAGGVAKHISKPLAGDFPSVFGEAGKQTNKQLSGIPPSPSGSVVKHTDKHLLGDIPSGAGVIIPSSDIAQSVYGELPSPSGGAIKHTAKQLSGASPSPTGDSTKHISTTLRGEAPAPSGTPNQAYRTSQSTSGIMGLIFGAISSILNPIVSLRSAAGIIGSRLKRFIGG